MKNIKTFKEAVNFDEVEELEINKCTFSNNPIPVTTAKVAYSKQDGLCVYLKSHSAFERAENTQINSPVYQDSCMEFFFSFDNQKYINVEVNPNAVFLSQIGEGRRDRKFLVDANLPLPKVKTTIEDNCWSAYIVIPNELIISAFKEIKDVVYLNIYCCGDKTPNPYYGAYNEPKSEVPDFHLIQFFKEFKIENI